MAGEIELMLLFRRFTFLMLLLLSSMFMLSASHETSKNKEYNPDVLIEPVDGCIVYMCKINTSIEFGVGSMNDIKNVCNLNDPADASRLEEFENNVTDILQLHKIGCFQLWKSARGWRNSRQINYRQEYIKRVKQFGNDSMQERFFWLYPLATLVYLNGSVIEKPILRNVYLFWVEKAELYIPSKLQMFTDEIQSAQKNVKEILKMKMDSLSRDLENVQKAANQILEDGEYFQKKYAEMKLKLDGIKICADEIFKSYVNATNKILENVKTELENAQSETMAAINALGDEILFDNLENIQNNILKFVNQAEDAVSNVFATGNETIISVSSCDGISILQALKAMKDFENDKEFKVLIKEVKSAVKEVKKIGEAAQKAAEAAQEVADESKTAGKNADKLISVLIIVLIIAVLVHIYIACGGPRLITCCFECMDAWNKKCEKEEEEEEISNSLNS